MLTANQVLHKGRYRVINAYGKDENAGLYEAYDTVSNTNVVLKESVGKVGKVATPNQIEAIQAAFLGGAKVLTEIKHEAIVTVQDYFSEIDRQYLVLESVAGFDLTKFLRPDERRPALNDVLSWADQLLAALNYLHTLPTPLIHRDIRPENVKLTSSFKVKLLTAGIANVDPEIITPVPNQPNQNNALHYRPLEQLWGGLDVTSQKVILNSYDEKSERMLMLPLDARSDLYSLGATLYHVLTGEVPKDALERSIAILESKSDPLLKPAEIDENIPPEVSEVLVKAMAIRREDRFDSAMILRQVLRTAVVRVKERKAEEAETAKMNRATPPSEVPKEIKSKPILETKAEKPVEKADSPTTKANAVEIQLKEAKSKTNEIDTIEAELERERLKAEERQREIEAEQARLDEERKRIEQRRIELEAEKERQRAERERLEREAEEARLKAEQERIAFEAEQERKRLEKERLEQEAEKERQRAAQKLAELEAAQAHQREAEERLVLQVEEERKRAEERLRELEAEQERKRLEKERLEQEAEAERQRAAQKLAELEAEQERQRSEQERLEQEAEDERKRTEQRLQELKEEQSRYHAEQQRIKAEAEQERKRTTQRLQELSQLDPDIVNVLNAGGFNTDHINSAVSDDNEDELLKLDVSDLVTEKTDDSDDSDEIAAEPIVEEVSIEEPAPEPEVRNHFVSEDVSESVQAYQSNYESSFSSYDEPSSFNWKMPAIAGGAVLLLIIAIGAWKLMSSSADTPTPQTTPTSAQSNQPATEIPESQPLAVQPAAESNTPSASEPAATSEADPRAAERARQAQLKAEQERLKKQAAPAKTPPPKKAVTVDDLLNDN